MRGVHLHGVFGMADGTRGTMYVLVDDAEAASTAFNAVGAAVAAGRRP